MNFVVAFVFFLCLTAAQAQTAGSSAVSNPPGACISYRFAPGDSLIYRSVSYDSVYFKETDPLMKKRMERIELVCDSVGSNGLIYLRQTLRNYIATESLGDIKDVVRTETPWMDRTAVLVIDSLGHRFIDSMEAPAKSALSPGGAFQPNLIIGLYDTCSGPNNIHRTWMTDRVTELVPESGYPAPMRVQTTLYELLPPADTLGFSCLRFQYTLTGQGSITAGDRKPPMRITSVIASGGNMLMSSEHRIPVHFETGAQIKMDITTGDGKLVKGTQYTQTFYTLEEFHRNGRTITDNAPAQDTGKKSGKKKGK